MSRVDEKLLKEAKKLPWEDRLLHKNWKVRNDANIDLTALFDSITDPKDPRIRELGHFFRKTVADSHARVQDKALDALIAYLKAADADATRRYAKEVCDAVVATCLTGCPKTVEKAQLVFMLWVELDSVDIFLDAMENATKHKDAKAVVPAIDVMFQALSEFGSKIVPPKRLLKMLPELFDHQDKNVRASSKELTLELCRWIGIDVVKSMLFRTMRDTTKKELEAELANVTGSAKPTRKIRSEQDKETKQEVQAGPSEESAAETPQEIDEYELVQEVDILTPLEKSGFWNGVKATKWSERKEAVAELTKLASTKRIAPGDFSEICRTLKKLITDVNIAVGVQAVQAVGNLALGLRTNFSRSSRFILPVLLEKLKEKKPTMTEALTNTLQAIHKAGCVTLADIVEDIKAAVKSKVPIVRSLTLNWVTHCMERSNRAVILKVHQDYVLICVECLNDGTRDVMDAAISVLAAIAKVVGMRALKNSLEKLDDVSQKKILDMVGFSGSGAPTVTRSVASLGGAASSAEVRQENDDTPLILTHKSAKFTLPGNIKKGLLEHQIEGIKWLWGLHVNQVGGILGDDMGVGKTRQISAFLAGLYNSKLTNKVLLVCPKTLLPQWSDEFLKMGLPPSNIYHGEDKIEELENFKQKDKGILLTTYTMVTLDGDSLCSLTLDYIILDEGHTIKNWKSKICENIKSIPSLHRIVVTGTPMQNNYEEIWTLFSFCAHKVFGDLDSFKKDVETPLVKGIQKFASIREKQLCITAKRKLDKALEHHLLRRTKDEVLSDFPNKTELVVWLKLDECQRELYKSIQESEIFSVACHSVPLAALIMLRKICSHPYLTGLSEGDKEEKTCGSEDGVLKDARILALKMNELTTTYPARLTSSKISFIKSLVVDLVKNHHILIFCQWKKMMDLIKVSLEKEDFECVRMDGNSSSEERKGAIEKFQSGKAKVFLLTSGVGGVGLNLTKADRVILADSAWNPSIDNQCADRAYRIGQTRNVVVYRILTCGTVEEAIYKTQVYKSSLIGSAMESELQCSYFTTKEKKACLEKTNFGFSSSINVLLKKQNREAKKNSILQQHIKHLNSLSHIAAILNHSSLFPKPAPKKPPPISDMGRETPNRITWYDELVAREENHDNEEKDHKASDGSSGRPSFGAETRPRSSSLSKTRNEWFKDTTTTSVVSEEKRDNEEKVVSPGNHKCASPIADGSSGPPSLGAQTRPGSPSLPKTRNDHGSHCPPTMPGPRGNFLRPHMTGRMPRQDPRRVPSPMSYQPNHPGMRPEMHESFNRQGMPGFYPRPRYHPNYHGRPP